MSRMAASLGGGLETVGVGRMGRMVRMVRMALGWLGWLGWTFGEAGLREQNQVSNQLCLFLIPYLTDGNK